MSIVEKRPAAIAGLFGPGGLSLNVRTFNGEPLETSLPGHPCAPVGFGLGRRCRFDGGLRAPSRHLLGCGTVRITGHLVRRRCVGVDPAPEGDPRLRPGVGGSRRGSRSLRGDLSATTLLLDSHRRLLPVTARVDDDHRGGVSDGGAATSGSRCGNRCRRGGRYGRGCRRHGVAAVGGLFLGFLEIVLETDDVRLEAVGVALGGDPEPDQAADEQRDDRRDGASDVALEPGLCGGRLGRRQLGTEAVRALHLIDQLLEPAAEAVALTALLGEKGTESNDLRVQADNVCLEGLGSHGCGCGHGDPFQKVGCGTRNIIERVLVQRPDARSWDILYMNYIKSQAPFA